MAKLSITQRDQYAIPFALTAHGEVVTLENVDDVRIQIGGALKSYSGGTLSYNASDKTWLYPVTEAETAALGSSVAYQVGIKLGDAIAYSPTGTLLINANIVKEAWP